ncbi:MAG: hypothetical protein L3J52_02415 [Proteobacteria bacterium]|nr:hypothetical protein [Pseudomonadota bacterium]
MANNKQYIIVDEPKVKFFENLIVNPVVILFAAMIVPMLFNIPFYGRWWLPFVWLIFNGIALGSPTLKKEIVYVLFGLLVLLGFFLLIGFLAQQNIQSRFSIFDYLIIVMYGMFFLFLYLVVFLQDAPYQIYQYVKEGK